MKNQFVQGSALVVASMVVSLAVGHEITTHALITDRAYRVSTLNPQAPNSVVPLLGINRLDDDQPFAFLGQADTTTYYDDAAVANPDVNLPPIASTLSVARGPQNQERGVLNDLTRGSYITGASGKAIEQQVRAWLMRGAVREDDNDWKLGWWHEIGDRDSDPYGYLFRAFRHFYDPYIDRAAENQSLCTQYGCDESTHWALGRTDPFHPASNMDDTNRRNHFSWQDARNNYWWALTLKRNVSEVSSVNAIVSSGERLNRWATTVNDLGHVIHLLQDTSQPQHVRNDLHGPPVTTLLSSEGAADGAFEAYTEYRVVRNYYRAGKPNISGGNPLRHMVGEGLPTENILPRIQMGDTNPYPGNGGQVMFSTPVKFFSTQHIETGKDIGSLRSRRGLADFSNRSFFTAGTLPGFHECQPPGDPACVPTAAPTYPLPPNDLSDPGYTEVLLHPSGLRVNDREVLYSEFAYPVTDSVAPDYDLSIHSLDAYGGKAPLVTKDVWYDVIPDDLKPQFLQRTGYVISYNNMRYMADVELPRAVGYSAGMIDYFFRGRLDLASPPGGLFGVVDQGAVHVVDPDGYVRNIDESIFGFETLRVRVKNATADITESGTGTVYPQTANGGQLVAIARYHRNPCYQIDLSGEYVKKPDGTKTVPAGCTLAQTRTDYQEISVSAPLTIDVNGDFAGVNNGDNACANIGNLDSGPSGDCSNSDGVLAEFDFSADAIPINATDLFLQVAYRGELGEEADGIALGRMDILEPNYYSIWNNTDWFLYNGQWRVPAEVSDSVPGGADPIPISVVYLCWEDQVVFGFEQPDPLGPGQFLRFATLADQNPHSITELVGFGGQNFAWVYNPFVGMSRQSEQEVGETWAPEPLWYGRGTTLGTLWDDYFKDYPHGVYPPPHDAEGVSLTLSLAPALGTENGPGAGLPVHGLALYLSSPDQYCEPYASGTPLSGKTVADGMQVERSQPGSRK